MSATTRARRKPARLVLENGQPSAVILDIEEYREMLERLQDLEDLKDPRRHAQEAAQVQAPGGFPSRILLTCMKST